MERHAEGTARVIPIILRPVDITNTPFSALQALPRSLKPVDKPGNDEEWVKIIREIRTICNNLRGIEKPS